MGSLWGAWLALPLLFQTPQGDAEEIATRLQSGEALWLAQRPREALTAFEAVLAIDSTNYEALWKAARSAIKMGELAADGSDEKLAWYHEAERHARRASAVNPEDSQGHAYVAASLGYIALQQSPKAKVEMSKEVRDEARRALELDPSNDVGHHVLGRWHAEILRLSGFSRTFAKLFLGADVFGEASWEKAAEHLRRAIELNPSHLNHHLELARIYEDMGDAELARREYETVLDLPRTDVMDAERKAAAADRLAKLKS
jgi:tetratricopeptide (TPR) repeat protein